MKLKFILIIVMSVTLSACAGKPKQEQINPAQTAQGQYQQAKDVLNAGLYNRAIELLKARHFSNSGSGIPFKTGIFSFLLPPIVLQLRYSAGTAFSALSLPTHKVGTAFVTHICRFCFSHKFSCFA
ncbi:hypothetical protein ALON55S_00031 [Alishewanella longhuensis]